jgi:hypothetical protein
MNSARLGERDGEGGVRGGEGERFEGEEQAWLLNFSS